MASFLQNLEVNMVIKEVQVADAAKKKIDDLTRLRLGLPAAGPVAFPPGSREATAKAMGAVASGGGVGGLVAQITTLTASIFSLAAIFMTAIANSKIIAMLSQTIGKALGLLVDVILMPFLPIFMILLVALFKGIMEFYKFWKGIISPSVIKAIEDIGSVLKLGLQGLFDLTLGAAITAGEDIWNFLKWLWGVITSSNGTADFVVNLLNTDNPTLNWIKGGIATLTVYVTEVLTKHLGPMSDANVAANDAINEIQYALGLRQRPPDWQNARLYPDFKPPMKYLDEGGTVSKTGVAVVHKGETVIPKGGGITVNITGQFKSDEDMYRRFVDRLRQEQWRTNV